MTEVAVQPVVGVLTDAAGVEDDHVGVVDVVGRHQAVGFEDAGQALGVVLVHLAAEGADEDNGGAADGTTVKCTCERVDAAGVGRPGGLRRGAVGAESAEA